MRVATIVNAAETGSGAMKAVFEIGNLVVPLVPVVDQVALAVPVVLVAPAHALVALVLPVVPVVA
ncbi:MAG TPA: hypothetical protein VMF06_07545 [Candidatus Limnocylindria bacterium]|jgi:hypothetical protein|nr:hypothetical protein [Candidatus Limnocylindria bacterium]